MDSAVQRAKDLARDLGWEQWRLGQTNNALELLEHSSVTAADLLEVVDGLKEAATRVLAQYEVVLEQMEARYERGDDWLKLESEQWGMESELEDLTRLHGGGVIGQKPSAVLYATLRRKLIILAATRDH